MESDGSSQPLKTSFRSSASLSTREQSVLLEEANRKWLELDKGMRSNDYGVLVYTIGTFPDFFMDFKLPAYINSGFMRLASAFRTSNNHVRWHLANVFIESKSHWSMVQNVNDICRMLVSIMYSNDQVARALTLTVIGTIAEAASDTVSLQRVLLESLDRYLARSDRMSPVRRHDQHERNAAIRGCIKFCRYSSSFSDKVLELMSARLRRHFAEDAEFPKLLSFMKLNAQKALEVFSLFERLISRETGDRYKTLCIRGLGACAGRNCLIVPSMMKMYSNRMQDKLNSHCSVVYLRTLERIIRNNPVVCSEELITEMTRLASTSENDSITTQALHLVASGLKTSLCDLDLPADFYQEIEALMFSSDVALAIEACNVAIFLICHRSYVDENAHAENIDVETVRIALLSLLQMAMEPGESRVDVERIISLVAEFCLCHEKGGGCVSSNLSRYFASLTDESLLAAILTTTARVIEDNLSKIGKHSSDVLINELIACAKRCQRLSARAKATLCLCAESGLNSFDRDFLNQTIAAVSPSNLYFFTRKAMKSGLFGCAKESQKSFLHLNLPFKYNVWMTSMLHACSAELELHRLSCFKGQDGACDLCIRDALYCFELSERYLSVPLTEEEFHWHKMYFHFRKQLTSLGFSLHCILSDCLGMERDQQFFDSQLLLCDLFAMLEEARSDVGSLMNCMFDADVDSIDEVQRQAERLELIDYLANDFIPQSSSDSSNDWPLVRSYLQNLDIEVEAPFEKKVAVSLECLHRVILRPSPFPTFLFQRFQTTQLQVNFSPDIKPYSNPTQIKSHEDLSILIEGFLCYSRCAGNVPVRTNSVKRVCIKVFVVKLPSNETAKDVMSLERKTNKLSQPLLEVFAPVNSEAYFATNVVIKGDLFPDEEAGRSVDKTSKFEPPLAKVPRSGGVSRDKSSIYGIALLFDYEDQRWRRWSNVAERITYVMRVGVKSRTNDSKQ